MPYTVTSDNFAHPRGTSLTDEQLVGVNIDALIKGGHLEPTTDGSAEPEQGA